jgi:hypothetical protein
VESTPWQRRWIYRFPYLLGIPAVVLPIGLFLYNRYHVGRDHASVVQAVIDEAVAKAFTLRVWGAGIRTGSGFCGCAVVPRPERVFYETRDLREIRDFGALLRARPYVEPPSLCKCCGQITIDFVRGEEILLSIHPHGELRSTRGVLPITPESQEALEEWLAKRSVRENLRQALRSP